MVRVLNVLAVMALFSVAIASRGLSQQPNAGAPAAGNQAAAARPAADPNMGTKVGVIDIGYIFDNHPSYKQQQDAIDAEIAKA
jgi:Skp family chaperone for outer membrane proteins